VLCVLCLFALTGLARAEEPPPPTFLSDRNGRIVHRAIGGREFDIAESLRIVKNLLTTENDRR
jgi:hypothetical protein